VLPDSGGEERVLCRAVVALGVGTSDGIVPDVATLQ